MEATNPNLYFSVVSLSNATLHVVIASRATAVPGFKDNKIGDQLEDT